VERLEFEPGPRDLPRCAAVCFYLRPPREPQARTPLFVVSGVCAVWWWNECCFGQRKQHFRTPAGEAVWVSGRCDGRVAASSVNAWPSFTIKLKNGMGSQIRSNYIKRRTASPTNAFLRLVASLCKYLLSSIAPSLRLRIPAIKLVGSSASLLVF
jgi:hypothetical protein